MYPARKAQIYLVELSNVETRLIASLHSIIQPGRSVLSGPDTSDLKPISSVYRRGGITGMHNPMLHQNLSRVMRWFTGRVSFEAHKIDPQFNWQRRFHDHIVRDIEEFRSISRYIIRNPVNWEKDQFYWALRQYYFPNVETRLIASLHLENQWDTIPSNGHASQQLNQSYEYW